MLEQGQLRDEVRKGRMDNNPESVKVALRIISYQWVCFTVTCCYICITIELNQKGVFLSYAIAQLEAAKIKVV